ncbi:MAG: hypothetical protein IT190_05170 [Microbacteriaceae bacterium]|nr:hypothetical protein [Microbacteriaceae bacterium]
MTGWLIDVVVGGIVGAVIGGIIALNVVIYSGTEEGYETGLGELFAFNWVVGILVVSVLAGFPVLGVAIARWWRRKRYSAA